MHVQVNECSLNAEYLNSSRLTGGHHIPSKSENVTYNNAYEVIVSIRSVVNFNPNRNNSAAISSPPSISRILRHPSRSSFQATQSRSAETRADRFVSERKGSSPQTVPATMVSIRTPCPRSYEARRMPLSSK